MAVLIIAAGSLGLGRPVAKICPKDLKKIGILNSLFATCAALGWAVSRSSAALMLWRMLNGGLRALMAFVMASVGLLGMANAVFWWAQCDPVGRNWDPSAEGRCSARHTRLAVGIVSAGYGALVDVVLLTVPWVMVWNRRVAAWEKAGLGVVTILGLV